jgi:threonine aldolase
VQTIDLRSDTVTRPGPAMRRAMAEAELGDDVYGEDPTVRRLEERAAELLGKQAALFVASGTMANQVAIRTHTRPGDAMIAGQSAHTFLFEGGGAAAISGVQVVLVGEEGFFDAGDVEAALYPVDDDHYPRTRLISAENTHNVSGGRVFPLDAQRRVAALARRRGLALHLDGARLFNAAAASGATPAELAAPWDSVAFCLSKGLGAPVGSLVVGSRDFVCEAHRGRKLLGGGMRQAGVLAAAGLYALEHHRGRLAEDHARAARLAAGLAELPGLSLVREPETNMVLLEAEDARGVVSSAGEAGVLLSRLGPGRIRAVTHMDLDEAAIDEALRRLRRALA